jgi:anaerobic magnesium-protoporphyrin IX monomethyl ester cyclase
MKVAFTYPPLESEKGTPLLSQNRQFQWFTKPTYIFPVIPATAATMARDTGHEVLWLDGIASQLTERSFLQKLQDFKPDIIWLETKTPVVKAHWKWIDVLKKHFSETKIVLCGDHVTALPRESFENSKVDYILTGGDYDFLLINLLNYITDPINTKLEPGIWLLEDGDIINTGKFVLDHELSEAPWIDRDLVNWELYAYKNGNFRSIPGTYIMSARDCWHHKCTFCSWTTIYPTYRFRDPIEVVDEIGHLIEKYNIKEIMDDSGTLPIGKWLKTFCEEMIKRGYNKKITLNCNMRFGCLTSEDYKLMAQAGFRFVLFGLESANQSTLDRLVKGINQDDIIQGAKDARAAGLDVHVTVMFGYPWETAEDMKTTVKMARELLIKGYAFTLQVTMVTPYPGTPLYDEVKDAGWLSTEDWDNFDMRMNVMPGEASEKEVKKAIRSVYSAIFHPMALINRLVKTKHPIDDAKFYARGFVQVIGHLADFKNR